MESWIIKNCSRLLEIIRIKLQCQSQLQYQFTCARLFVGRFIIAFYETYMELYDYLYALYGKRIDSFIFLWQFQIVTFFLNYRTRMAQIVQDFFLSSMLLLGREIMNLKPSIPLGKV